MMQEPLISIIICTYNGADFLEETLRSVMNQTYKNIEIVVVDDGSKDNTCAVVEKCSEEDRRIVLYKKKNGGLPSSRNYAFEKAKGEWIAIIDQDDLCYPTRIEKQYAVSLKYPSAGLIFCNTDYIDTSGKKTGEHLTSFNLPGFLIPKGIAASILLKQGCYVDSEAVFISKQTVTKLEPMKNEFRYACDYEYFIRAGLVTDFAYTDAILAAWRIHTKQETAVNPNMHKEISAVFRMHMMNSGLPFLSILSNVKSYLVLTIRNIPLFKWLKKGKKSCIKVSP